MILVKPDFKILEIMAHDVNEPHQPIQLIERCGRICYKSEDKMTEGSAEKFVKMVRDRGHHSVIEHSAMTVWFQIDRGVSHELVRHRLCAFSQESTRYCNYKGGVTFVIPPWIRLVEGEYQFAEEELPWNCDKDGTVWEWFDSLQKAERTYIALLALGWTPQQARSVLPNSLKTEIVVTANFREWRHIFNLRCSKAAHPQMREIMLPTLAAAQAAVPVIFDDILEN